MDLNVEGVGNPIVTVASIRGEILESSTPRAERTSGVATTAWGEGPYVVVVTQNSNNRNPYTLTGSHPLFAVDDPDDDRQLQFGDAYIGSIDNPADADHFTIDLRAGDRIVVEVESLTIDPVIVIRYESRGRVEVAFDDNSGPTGIFGVNARAVLVAPEDGEYTIFVDTYNDSAVGGYILNVSEGKWGDAVTETGFSLEHYLTSRGLFSRYMSDSFPFTMLYPANYEWGGEDCEDVTACFQSDTEYLGIMEASPSELTPSERDLDIMLNDLRMGMESGLGETEVLSRRDLTTHQGLDAKMESMTAYDGGAYIASFVFFDEEIGMFVGTFIIGLGADADLDAVEDFTEFLFSTVHVYDEERLADDVAFYLEQGMHQAAKGEYLSALGNLKFALTLNEELTEAHTLRAMIHANMGNYDLAVEYLDAALELEPDNVELLTSQAYLFWYLGDYEEALEQTDRIIELRPDAHSIYNERALYRASVGNYEGALAELAQYEEMAEDGLPANVLDTRAFVYLMSGDLEAALSDYEEILADDFQHPITLLGAGITFARLDRMDEAMPLLDYGMEKFEEGEYEIIDPQLTEILAWAEEILETENAQ